MKCQNESCDCFPVYGVAPHKHIGITDDPKSFIGSTRIEPKEKWPEKSTYTVLNDAEGEVQRPPANLKGFSEIFGREVKRLEVEFK